LVSGNPDNQGLLYRGRPVEELTKDDLIDAIYHMARTIESMRRMHEDYVSLQKELRSIR